MDDRAKDDRARDDRAGDDRASRTARQVRVTGRVQGVGFRWSTRRHAEGLGLAGWVKNLDDGSVETHVEGAAAAVEELVRWLRRGPPGARVDALDARELEPEGLDGFRVLR